IDDPSIKSIVFGLSKSDRATLEQVKALKVQFEEGSLATKYEPRVFSEGSLYAIERAEIKAAEMINTSNSLLVGEFTELDTVRLKSSAMGVIKKDFDAANGLTYAMEAVDGAKNTSKILYSKFTNWGTGKKSFFINMMQYIDSTGSASKNLNRSLFNVPSGQLDNPGSFSNMSLYDSDDYTHPDIAYSPTGVGGFKYWMIASILPAQNMGDVEWEDEDVFVSNDAVNWLRIKSVYEDAKSYTAPNLSLPPQALATTNARKHAFLPMPSLDTTIEISCEATEQHRALDREITKITALPWKHDPAVFIDSGYVYFYHTFNLRNTSVNGVEQGQKRFLVCVRTNNGTTWEVVRSDGSTMLLTEDSSRKLFTKDSEGRYNYICYLTKYSAGQNPTVVKYGENDYEFIHGYNYNYRFKGTNPYNFDFSTQHPMQDTGGYNHPGLFLHQDTLYVITDKNVYHSSNRGVSFKLLPHYPLWLGGVHGEQYKKAFCIGENGKLICVDAQRQIHIGFNTPSEGHYQFNKTHQMYIYTFENVDRFIDLATTGLRNAYCDLQITIINEANSTRSTRLVPAIYPTRVDSWKPSLIQKVKAFDIELKDGDEVHIFVVLNARDGTSIKFSGLQIN
ncbi:hypothetical protein G4V72_17100, partial [Acinetobacter sp. GC2]|uniref:hypothetical protein n=1 Tax=Acinetobacter lwoffii TaxID=28090 RepID=UPI001B3B66EE